MEKKFQANGIWKQAKVAILIFNKVDFRTIRKDEDGHYIFVKVIIHQEDIKGQVWWCMPLRRLRQVHHKFYDLPKLNQEDIKKLNKPHLQCHCPAMGSMKTTAGAKAPSSTGPQERSLCMLSCLPAHSRESQHSPTLGHRLWQERLGLGHPLLWGRPTEAPLDPKGAWPLIH